jgi:calcineurin-like phosphoesterase family protein
MPKIFVTSDQHFGHTNIINICKRPFNSVWEMNECLINNYNKLVDQNDHVYILGDMFFKINKHKAVDIIKRLNGKKFLVRGNHDKVSCKEEVAKYFEWIKDYYELTVQDPDAPGGKRLVILTHYAKRVWNKKHWGSFCLYGHSHGNLPEEPDHLSIDIGVDAIAKRFSKEDVISSEHYRPISYEEVKKIMEAKKQLLKNETGYE